LLLFHPSSLKRRKMILAQLCWWRRITAALGARVEGIFSTK